MYHKTQAVFFDLDGTLADTGPDMAAALNFVLTTHNKQTVAYDELRHLVSHGSLALVRKGFGDGYHDQQLDDYCVQLRAYYLENICVHTKLFDGMDSLLSELEQREIKWGVVTNKPAFLTDPLMIELALENRAASIISGDTLPVNKPHPAPMLLACEQAQCEPQHSVYIGDALRDIQAGNACGMKTLVAGWGYIHTSDKPETWCANGHINHPLDTLQWL